AQKCRDRGEQALLQADEGEFRQGGLLRRQRRDAAPSQLAVGRQAAPQVELWCIIQIAPRSQWPRLCAPGILRRGGADRLSTAAPSPARGLSAAPRRRA